MFLKKTTRQKRSKKFARWAKAVFLRKSVCPFCQQMFHSGNKNKKHKTSGRR